MHLPAMIAPRTYAHTRSLSSRARLRLISPLICLLMIPDLRLITFLFPPLHAAECDATVAMKRSAASPNLPNVAPSSRWRHRGGAGRQL